MTKAFGFRARVGLLFFGDQLGLAVGGRRDGLVWVPKQPKEGTSEDVSQETSLEAPLSVPVSRTEFPLLSFLKGPARTRRSTRRRKEVARQAAREAAFASSSGVQVFALDADDAAGPRQKRRRQKRWQPRGRTSTAPEGCLGGKSSSCRTLPLIEIPEIHPDQFTLPEIEGTTAWPVGGTAWPTSPRGKDKDKLDKFFLTGVGFLDNAANQFFIGSSSGSSVEELDSDEEGVWGPLDDHKDRFEPEEDEDHKDRAFTLPNLIPEAPELPEPTRGAEPSLEIENQLY